MVCAVTSEMVCAPNSNKSHLIPFNGQPQNGLDRCDSETMAQIRAFDAASVTENVAENGVNACK